MFHKKYFLLPSSATLFTSSVTLLFVEIGKSIGATIDLSDSKTENQKRVDILPGHIDVNTKDKIFRNSSHRLKLQEFSEPL